MRILIHDFAGHPFQIQLSRELARRGHIVTHAYPLGLPGPKGRLARSAEDPEGFNVQPIALSGSFRKYAPLRRLFAQRRYARDLKALVSSEKPDVVLSGNTPIDIQCELLWWCRRNHVAFVHWVQDVYSHAIEFFLRRKIGALATLLSSPFQQVEKQVVRRSNGAIVIAEAFAEILLEWGVERTNLAVIENWAPLDEVAYLPIDNEWRDAHGLRGKTVFLYSGTMGLKHRPDLLYSLAASLADNCKLVVVTEGIGRDYLERMPRLENLLLLDFQPYEILSTILASADVLVATLESEAGRFAVPSKILSYLCAGRPILLSAPEDNLAAEVVRRSGAGFVADPAKPKEWTDAANLLASDPVFRGSLGQKARSYAEQSFDIGRIAAAFEKNLAWAFRPTTVTTNAPTKGTREVPQLLGPRT